MLSRPIAHLLWRILSAGSEGRGFRIIFFGGGLLIVGSSSRIGISILRQALESGSIQLQARRATREAEPIVFWSVFALLVALVSLALITLAIIVVSFAKW
jgi:hypothetical protein